MRSITQSKFINIFKKVGSVADSLGYQCFVVGGFVRDFLLNKDNDDLDFVVVGSGLTMATEVAKAFNTDKLSLYESYGTAKVDVNCLELEFVGARKEFYHRESRNPIVENGTIDDDMDRRDLTINDIAICLNKDKFGEFYDPHNGIQDLESGICKTPLDPNITFSDDPLRMLRCIRFACRFNFEIDDDTYDALKTNANRITIITKERICEELQKMMAGFNPARAISIISNVGLLPYVLPDIATLSRHEVIDGVGHKDIFFHTVDVLRYVADKSEDEWLRWAAIFHDVGKGPTKKFIHGNGSSKGQWTFENHAFVGAKMIPNIFKKIGLPLDDRMKKVQKLVELHMRPMQLCDEGVSDAAVRRILFDAGDYIDDLIILCNADITTTYADKAKKFRDNYDLLVKRMHEIEESDHIRNFQPVIDGNEIMEMFNLTPSRIVGTLKDAEKNAVLDGIIKNEYEEAKKFLIDLYNEISKQ